MKQILFISVSPRGEGSASRAVADALTNRLRAIYPTANIMQRDLAVEQLPHLDLPTLTAISTKDPEEAAQLKEAALQSDEFTDELLRSDLLVVATPMWNFGIPSTLKAWIDLVVRPGRTFQYSENGVDGLAKNKKAILVLASGGVFSAGPWQSWDFVEPYLRKILGFIGIHDVQTVRVQGMNIPALSGDAIARSILDIEKITL